MAGSALFADPRARKIVAFGSLVIVFCITELIIGAAANSLALMTDAIHTFGDVASLVIGLAAVTYGKRGSDDRYTYGWARAELVGGLMNGCFLFAICLFILLESIHRFIEEEEIRQPMWVIVVGSVGFLMNAIGLCFFHGYGYGHGHSHGGSSEGHGHGGGVSRAKKDRHHTKVFESEDEALLSLTDADADAEEEEATVGGLPIALGAPLGHASLHAHAHSHSHAHAQAHAHSHGAEAGHSDGHGNHGIHHGHHGRPSLPLPAQDIGHAHAHASSAHGHSHGGSKKGKADANMHAIFLHILGDFAGNLGVIASGVIQLVLKSHFKYYADPAVSVLIALFVLSTCLPLIRRCASVLLQKVPDVVSLTETKAAISRVPGVLDAHELHVWELVDGRNVCTVHVTHPASFEAAEVLQGVESALHTLGIHSVTVQTEATPVEERTACTGLVCDNAECAESRCCPITCHTEHNTDENM